MQKVLASKGFTHAAHQTPLDFTFALNIPEAVCNTKIIIVCLLAKKILGEEARETKNWHNDLAKNNK